MASSWVGFALGLSWAVCWYFFFVRYGRGRRGVARASRPFALTSYAVLAVLAFWSACMWGLAPRAPSALLLLAGGFATVLGQWLICAARRALPLSNYDVLMRVAAVRVQGGAYRFIAHPMYAGLLLALVGSSVVLGNKAALLVLLVLAPLLALRAVIEGDDDICCGHGGCRT